MILRSRSFLSILIWMLVIWILIMQLYMTLFPPQLLLSDLRTNSRHSLVTLEHPNRITRPRYENSATFQHYQHHQQQQSPEDEDEQAFKHFSAKNLPGFPGALIDPVHGPENNTQFFLPGAPWLDSDGNIIQAHGGGILHVPETGVFYWYGENKDGPTYFHAANSLARVDLVGVSCYSSRDLWTWKNEGIVLASDKEDESSDLYYKNVMERPKVIFNEKTHRYVMWMHIDNANYSKASLGVAVSPNPEGPFEYLGSKQPHAFESRDMTIFKDEDGEAYVIYSSEDNSALHITPLQEDYLGFRNIMSRVFVEQHREAPSVFKHRGVYYMVTSGCTGWEPNSALVHVAENILGPWETSGNPCVGGNRWFRSTTFFSQGSFVLPVPGSPELFIFMADRWNASELRSSRYVWLPLTVDGPVDEPVEESFEFPFWFRVSIRWHSRWKLPLGWQKQEASSGN